MHVELDEKECGSCGSSGVFLKEYRAAFLTEKDSFCDLCAGTMISRADYIHPISLNNHAKSMAYIGNEILKAINELKNELKGDK